MKKVEIEVAGGPQEKLKGLKVILRLIRLNLKLRYKNAKLSLNL